MQSTSNIVFNATLISDPQYHICRRLEKAEYLERLQWKVGSSIDVLFEVLKQNIWLYIKFTWPFCSWATFLAWCLFWMAVAWTSFEHVALRSQYASSFEGSAAARPLFHTFTACSARRLRSVSFCRFVSSSSGSFETVRPTGSPFPRYFIIFIFHRLHRLLIKICLLRTSHTLDIC